ncbi:putative amidoligase enzyme-domain-containing protein [Annulohypoxylon maeteangense]|uniref:putative amidoligase enzyme-domain-containing protein n=1 Tax=Annulohypoxylon maeteangense TaxID=1927788 RepID=UPI002007C59E|nr:putative amidoligase enzyme-domain-containing protein [Annulohypoxylon maeteangense]KAI0888097.1 putative amidoligase enzyme-domain-containing protein [Annulohypoxylon maeteangense]
MSTQNQDFPGERKRTFGVELEIIVAWLWDDEPDPHQAIASTLPPILRCPVSLKKAYDEGTVVGEEKITKLIFKTFTDILKKHGLPTDLMEGIYDQWRIKSDETVSSIEGDYKWSGMEIVSPVERASDESFQLIRYTLDLLRSNYRIMVNNTCGLHVHVGDGSELMPLDHVKRVAGLFWAADPLLACIHPPHRRTNFWCQSIRERSNLAHGLIRDDDNQTHLSTCNYLGGSTRHGESPVSWREKYHDPRHLRAYEATRVQHDFEPFFMKDPNDRSASGNNRNITPSSSDGNLDIDIQVEKYAADKGSWDAMPKTPYVSTRDRKTPRFAYPVYTPEDPNQTMFSVLDDKAEDDIGVFAGVQEIYSCVSSCMIEWLLRAGDRPNYNLRAYACRNHNQRLTRPGTIEFREALGTVDGKWAETWARICVGLTQFAIHAPVKEYLAVLCHIDRAANEGAPYDVLDLLDEAGLFAEAVVVEKRLIENKENFRLKVMPN